MTDDSATTAPKALRRSASSETSEPRTRRRISLRAPISFIAAVSLFPLIQPVLAQAPVNDVVSWPAGLLLLATVLYAALGTSPDTLWDIDPSIGIFLWNGLPMVSIPTMQKVNWVSETCHFVPGIRTAFGKANFWIRSEEVSDAARKKALDAILSILHPVRYIPRAGFDERRWTPTSAGLFRPVASPPSSPDEKEAKIDSSASTSAYHEPSARDFLLFAAMDYHVFREWEVRIISRGRVVFNTLGQQPSCVIDVDSEETAMYVAASNMVRRPHSQSQLRALAQRDAKNDFGPYNLDLDKVPKDIPVCKIDFHSYAHADWKVSATLTELAGAYYRVVQYIKRSAKAAETDLENGSVAYVDVGQSIWIGILGGALLDVGRLTIQNLPGRWGMKDTSADEAFVSRIVAVSELVRPYANSEAFADIVYSGGLSRRPAIPFLLAGLFGQIVVCYFLSVGTSAGVWTSVALANSLYVGKLTDLHSLYYGKTAQSTEPGLKMYVPGTTDLMCIATLDRTTPRQGTLRPGILLTLFGLAASILGAVFQHQTRVALGFNAFQPCRSWVVYTAIVMTVGLCLLISATIALQYATEKTWDDDDLLPTRWMIYFTLPSAVVVAALGLLFRLKGWTRFWPVLDAVTWVTGLPLGMLENGRIIPTDDNILHLVLVVRWLMGAVASAVGSSGR